MQETVELRSTWTGEGAHPHMLPDGVPARVLLIACKPSDHELVVSSSWPASPTSIRPMFSNLRVLGAQP